MKQLAIIGPTASGKSALALELAERFNAIILSIDSLSVYKEIDIVSAKPTPEERSSVLHFGIDVLSPDQNANVFTFIHAYDHARAYVKQHNTNLLIIGGSSFYLKSMLDGLSDLPEISLSVRDQVSMMLTNCGDAYNRLCAIDPTYASNIAPSDRYRIEKLLHIYYQTSTPPSEWFAAHPPKPILQNCPVFNLAVDRDLLRRRIQKRTQQMVEHGLIDEIAYLEKIYGRTPNSMKAIGVVETLQYLDGHISKSAMIEAISTHTAQLAKRQTTFNSHQFIEKISGTAHELYPYAEQWLVKGSMPL